MRSKGSHEAYEVAQPPRKSLNAEYGKLGIFVAVVDLPWIQGRFSKNAARR